MPKRKVARKAAKLYFVADDSGNVCIATRQGIEGSREIVDNQGTYDYTRGIWTGRTFKKVPTYRRPGSLGGLSWCSMAFRSLRLTPFRSATKVLKLKQGKPLPSPIK